MIKINKIAVATLLVMALAGTICITGCSGKKEKSQTVKEKVEEKEEEIDSGEEEVLEENEDDTEMNTNTTEGLVTDADYADKTLAGKDLKIASGYSVSYDDFKAPLINLKDGDVEKVNAEIKKVFDDQTKKFAEKLNEGGEVDIGYKSKYEAYLNGNVVSVVYDAIECDVTDYSNYYIYNIDKANGKLLSFESLCKEVGMTAADAKEKFKKTIESNYKEMESDAFVDGETADEFIKTTYAKFEDELSKGEVPFYIEGEGRLTFIFEMPLPSNLAGAGDMRTHYVLD